jgi:hypothetical protein
VYKKHWDLLAACAADGVLTSDMAPHPPNSGKKTSWIVDLTSRFTRTNVLLVAPWVVAGILLVMYGVELTPSLHSDDGARGRIAGNM